MMTESYGHLRSFTPAVLEAVDFSGGTRAASLLEAVKILKELNAKKARKVPDAAPDDFVLARWRGYLADAVAADDSIAYRHFWELTVLLGLRDGLRSGDVWVCARLAPLRRPGSERRRATVRIAAGSSGGRLPQASPSSSSRASQPAGSTPPRSMRAARRPARSNHPSTASSTHRRARSASTSGFPWASRALERIRGSRVGGITRSLR
jgi:hypothetical protein